MAKPEFKNSNILCSLPHSLCNFLNFLSSLAQLGLCTVLTDELC